MPKTSMPAGERSTQVYMSQRRSSASRIPPRRFAPIVSDHDDDGLDLYFVNHKSADPGALSEGVAAGGYRGIKRAATVTEIFAQVRLQGGTPTGTRVHNILKPYLAKLETEMAAGKEMKPLNLIDILRQLLESF